MARPTRPVWTTRIIASPVGPLQLCASARGLSAVLWKHERDGRVALPELVTAPGNPILDAAEAQLAEYFAGTRHTFGLPLDAWGTPFQRGVWAALATIPFGQTRSYGDIARQIGNPAAIRAVGAANGRNPISIIVPCHRVIGADGSLTGFGGGLEAKRYLLDLEAGRASLFG